MKKFFGKNGIDRYYININMKMFNSNNAKKYYKKNISNVKKYLRKMKNNQTTNYYMIYLNTYNKKKEIGPT